MECREARGLLGDYSAENLDACLTRRVEEHLRDCSECRGHLTGLFAAGRMLESLQIQEPPAEIWQRIQARGARFFATPDSTSTTASPRRLRWAVASALGAALLLALSVLLSLHFLSPRPPESLPAPPFQVTVETPPSLLPAGLAGYFHQHAAASTQDMLADPVSLGMVMLASDQPSRRREK